MKKVLLCAAFAVFGLSSVTAQETSFGLKGGLNFATLGGDAEDVESLTSFHLGGFAQIKISEKFMIQPELVYSGQGAQDSVENDLKIKLNYINLPIMAKFMVSDGLSFEVGPQIGFAVSRKVTFEGESENLDDEFKAFDYGVGLGAGYQFDSGMLLSLRYNLGLANILENEIDDFRVNNNVFQISVGYVFN